MGSTLTAQYLDAWQTWDDACGRYATASANHRYRPSADLLKRESARLEDAAKALGAKLGLPTTNLRDLCARGGVRDSHASRHCTR